FGMKSIEMKWKATGYPLSEHPPGIYPFDPATMLVVVGLGLGAVGLILLGQSESTGAALGAIVLMGVGLSLPYPLYYDDAERVLPDGRIGSLGLMQVGAGLFPIPVIPAFGAALAAGNADWAFAALGAFALLTLALNAQPPVAPRASSPS